VKAHHIATLVALLLAGALAPGPAARVEGAPTACVNPSRPAQLMPAFVTRIVDGDTVDTSVAGRGRERIRLLGIDTPEVYESEKLDRDAQQSGQSREAIQALGRVASEYTRRHLDGKDVGLELDVQQRDRYGRLLAHIWLVDGTLFNLQILRDGYAQILTIPPNVKYTDLFLACQREAREQGRGLWGR